MRAEPSSRTAGSRAATSCPRSTTTPTTAPPSAGPSAHRRSARTISAIADRRTFAELRRSGRRVRRGPLALTWVAGSSADPVRVAYAIGRNVGGAVSRNRLRRRLRAVLASQAHRLAPGAYLIGAGPAAAGLTHDELQVMMAELLQARS